MTNEANWRALAELLRHQRVVVLGKRSRAQFARELGLNSDRVLNDLENAARTSYSVETLLALQDWYRLPEQTLAGVLGDSYPTMSVIDTTVGEHISVTSSIAGVQTISEIRHTIDALTAALSDLRDKLDELERE